MGDNPLLNCPASDANCADQLEKIIPIPKGFNLNETIQIRRGNLLLWLVLFLTTGYLVGKFLNR